MSTKTQQLQIRVTPEQKAALKRLARRAGQDVSHYVLARALPPEPLRFEEIFRALRRGADDRTYALAELSDFLEGLAPGQLRRAVGDADLSDLSGLDPILQNTVAAMVEQACVRKGVAAPPWVESVPALESPHFATELKSLRLHLLKSSPPAFKRRNLFVDSTVGDRV